MKNTRGIYALRDASGVVRYIGMSSNIEKRFQWHKCFKKWVADWVLLQEVSHSENMRPIEKDWIAKYKESGTLINKACGGNGGPEDPSVCHRTLLSENTKKYWNDPEWKESQSAKIKAGINNSTSEYRSQIKKDLWADPATRQRIISSLKRRGATEEFRKQQRKSAMRFFADPAVIEKLRAGAKRRWTAAERARAADLMRRRMQDPTFRAKSLNNLNRKGSIAK